MSELFFRDGTKAAETRTTESGKAVAPRFHACHRCGGAGRSDRWAHTGFVCYDCAGSRGTTKFDPVYTAEKLAKLNATRDAKAAVRAAKAKAAAEAAAAKTEAERAGWMAVHGATVALAERYAARVGFLADLLDKLQTRLWSEGQLAAVVKITGELAAADTAKAASEFVGKIGERIEAEVKVERVYTFERAQYAAHWLTETVAITTMRDSLGNAIVVKSPSFRPVEGDTFKVRGTVKAQEVYKGEKQTTLTRAKIIDEPESLSMTQVSV